jgi:hypothetical protein
LIGSPATIIGNTRPTQSRLPRRSYLPSDARSSLVVDYTKAFR